MATAQQIRETAAENLAILGEGQVLTSYASDDLDQAYTEVYEQLQQLGLTTWSSTANVPDQYAGPVAMLVAEARAVKYRVPDAQYQRIKLEGSGSGDDGLAMKMIRKLSIRSKMGQTEIENF